MKFTDEQLKTLGDVFYYALNFIENLKTKKLICLSFDKDNKAHVIDWDKKQKDIEMLAKDIEKQLNMEEL